MPMTNLPIVSGDCRGSHWLHWYPAAWGEQTSMWSGPILQVLTASINVQTGLIGSLGDQFAKGTPWDNTRLEVAQAIVQYRRSTGFRNPGTLGVSEMEYQPGYKKAMARLNESANWTDITASS